MNFAILPNLIALTILVAIFWAISRNATPERLHLWLDGWFLVLVHFIAQFVTVGEGTWSRFAQTISLDALVLASVAFLISVISMESVGYLGLALSLALPAIVYTTCSVWGVAGSGYYLASIAAGVIAPMIALWRLHPKISTLVAAAAGVGSVAAVAGWAVRHNNVELGIIAILAALNFAAAILYWNAYRRASAGVVTAVTGFALWGAVFPSAALLQVFAPGIPGAEAWNVPKYLVAVGMILTLLEDQIQTSKYLAYHDDLTGLPNRRLLEDRLERALAVARRAGTRVAVLQLDLDHFKEVNDTYGHRVGDVALRKVVGRLGACIRAGDTLARSGGDEFTIIGNVMDVQGAHALVTQLVAALSTPIEIDSHEVQTGLSIGVALFPEDGADPDQLHAAADRAMYVAKRATRASASVEELPSVSA
jgi:diguanylate cyclase (GGDEF)-like protein